MELASGRALGHSGIGQHVGGSDIVAALEAWPPGISERLETAALAHRPLDRHGGSRFHLIGMGIGVLLFEAYRRRPTASGAASSILVSVCLWTPLPVLGRHAFLWQ